MKIGFSNICLKRVLTSLFTSLLTIFPFKTTFSLDSVYHTPAEMNEVLIELEESFPDWVRVDSVGHSTQYGRPIWMVKLSDNPDQEEPEPSILFIGQVHAEEVEGIEVCISLMQELLNNLDQEEFRNRLEELELYFILTANPEGLEVVHSGEDVTYRKNCRNNTGDDEFRFQEGFGWDTSGVDLNRNFGLHWDRGLGLFEREDEQGVYNYYRGPGPSSESEVEMLSNLALTHRFFLSVSYHSSRTGLNSEKVIAPWNWEGKFPPDSAAIDGLLEAVSTRIPTQDNNSTYEPVHTLGRIGQSLDWFYQAVGTIQFLIEIGDGIQQDSTILVQLIEEQKSAAYFMMDFAAGNASLPNLGTLTVLATNENNGDPLEVEIAIYQLSDPVLEPRKTEASTGRFDWLLSSGLYDITISSPGFGEQTFLEYEINSRERSELRVELTPLEIVRVQFRARHKNNREPVSGDLKIKGNAYTEHQFYLPEIGLILNLPIGGFTCSLISEGYSPLTTFLQIEEGRIVHFELDSAATIYDQEFDQFGNWQHGGASEWNTTEQSNRNVLTESPVGDYASDGTAWVLIQTGQEFFPSRQTVMRLIHRPYFEPGLDFGNVKIWDWDRNENQLVQVKQFSQFPGGWDTTFIDLNQFSRGEIIIRFEVTSDESVEEDGWLIDRMTLYQSERDNQIDQLENKLLPGKISLLVYPNPLNGIGRIRMELPRRSYAQITLYDLRANKVQDIKRQFIETGVHYFSLDGSSLPTGLYFLNAQTGYSEMQLPVLIVK